ncbi:YneF family protein [Mesomycoplasma molare]|uniref:YneF family protein n=1 Tax=Mesomycoplasma molare TaxID=171288 RepID=A0ABY5TV50_9BACT|nr:YneF family protein [Mesomycoplasma molare]
MLKLFSDSTTENIVYEAGGVGLGGWIGIVISVAIVLFIVGAIIGIIVSKKMFEKQIKENPPINEKMIRAMFLQMGRKASETQIKAVMRSMKNAK